MKLLKIVSLGIIIWGLSLIWLDLNQMAASLIMLGLALGLAALLPAYFLGKHLGKHSNRRMPEQVFAVHRLRSTAVVYARNHHSLPTRPMPVVQTLNSRPTRPMPINMGR